MKLLIIITTLHSLNVIYSIEIDTANKYKYISYNNVMINNEKMDIRLLDDNFLFKGYMVFEIPDNSNKFDSTYFDCHYFWVHSINDIADPCKHFDYVFPLYYSNYTHGNYDSIIDSIKSVYFEEFSDKYLKLLNKVNQQDQNDKYFLWKMLKTVLFDNSEVVLYQRDINSPIGYYVFECSFKSLLIEFSGYKFDDKLNSRIFKALIPTSKIIQWLPVVKEEMLYYGYQTANWKPNGLYIK